MSCSPPPRSSTSWALDSGHWALGIGLDIWALGIGALGHWGIAALGNGAVGQWGIGALGQCLVGELRLQQRLLVRPPPTNAHVLPVYHRPRGYARRYASRRGGWTVRRRRCRSNAQCPMPNCSMCPMPNAQCPMPQRPNAPMPQCPMPPYVLQAAQLDGVRVGARTAAPNPDPDPDH